MLCTFEINELQISFMLSICMQFHAALRSTNLWAQHAFEFLDELFVLATYMSVPVCSKSECLATCFAFENPLLLRLFFRLALINIDIMCWHTAKCSRQTISNFKQISNQMVEFMNCNVMLRMDPKFQTMLAYPGRILIDFAYVPIGPIQLGQQFVIFAF